MDKPKHVSIIMDGNGRWARERGRERVYGHRNGAESVRAVIEECAREEIPYLSLFAFSEENWARPAEEVSFLMSMMLEMIRRETSTFIKNGIRCLVKGNRERLSAELRAAVEDVEKKTEQGTRLTVIIFLSYSGKWDIFQAAQKMAADLAANPGKKLSQNDFDSYLVTAGIPDPDLIIRTSGELRISNYLLWQGAYSEFYFTDICWPDFRAEAFRQAIEDYCTRDRRYGKVK